MSAPDVVRRWVAAVNALDLEAMLELAHPDVRLHSSHASYEGHDGVREFARRQTFGVRLQVANRRTFHRGDTVVTDDELSFVSVDDGSVMGRQPLACRFVVRDGRLHELHPHRELADALAAAGLDEGDVLA